MIILQTFDNKNFEVTEEQVEKIRELSTSGKVNGIWIGQDYIAFPSIKEIYEESKPSYPQLPPVSYEKIIKGANKKSHLEALARGLKKAKNRINGETPNIDSLLKLARQRYKEI